jgi:O-antigen/teichoic acid export membrane protein
MSSIRKQSLYSSLFIYAGFVLGAVNILWLFPNQRYFSTEEFGLTRLLLDVAILFSTACTLGSLNVTFKFFPFYQHYLPKEKNDLPFLTLITTAIGCLLFVLVVPLLEPFLLRKFGGRSPLFLDYFYLVYPFTIAMAAFSLMEAYAWSLHRTILSNFLKEFLSRLITTVLILLLMAGIISSFRVFVNLYAVIYGLMAILLFAYFRYRRELPLHADISPVTRRLWPKMLVFGFSFFLSAMLNILAKTNDTIIIASQSRGGLVDTAVFVIATYLVTLMDVPQRSLISAATAQISVAWKEKDMEKIGRLYRKTALNLLIAAIGILGLLLVNAGSLVEFLGETYAPVPLLLVLLGFARLIDLGTGLNSQILVLSKYWKVDLVTNVLYVAVSILLNYLLTVRIGVMGPAWGGLIAVVLFNALRFGFLWKLYHLQPFTIRNLQALALGLGAFLAVYVIPATGNLYANVVIRSALFTTLFAGGIGYFRISPDLNDAFVSVMERIRRNR